MSAGLVDTSCMVTGPELMVNTVNKRLTTPCVLSKLNLVQSMHKQSSSVLDIGNLAIVDGREETPQEVE